MVARRVTLSIPLALFLVAACDGSTITTDAGARDAATVDLATGAGPPGDAGAPPPDGSSDGGKPLLAPCTSNAECASMLCHFFPGKGASFCSKTCKTDGDCQPASPGCNPMGVCRIQ